MEKEKHSKRDRYQRSHGQTNPSDSKTEEINTTTRLYDFHSHVTIIKRSTAIRPHNSYQTLISLTY